MVALIECFACRRGDCKHCEGGRAAPSGVMGGTQCPCRGDCKPQCDPELERIIQAFADSVRK